MLDTEKKKQGSAAKFFLEIANSPEGKQLMDFLSSNETMIRFETSTLLGRPALEGIPPKKLHDIQDVLKKKYGVDISESRWKQFMGWATKQILTDGENPKYQVSRNGVQIRVEGSIFSTATRYEFTEND